MTLKMTIQGGLIYLTFLFFLATFIMTFLRTRFQRAEALEKGFWAAGFLVALCSLVWRGIHTGHPPMQNLFEFFLCMATVLAPLSWWNARKHQIDTIRQDAFLGLLILFPAGFVFSEEVRRLPPALQSPLFIPHVAAYVAGYVMMARATLFSTPLLKQTPSTDREQRRRAVTQSVCTGFLLITIGLLLGSIWGKICWGHYWQWDPKEMWSLATWFVYIAYFHVDRWKGIRDTRPGAILLWVGLLFILLTLTWINLSRLFTGMHTYA